MSWTITDYRGEIVVSARLDPAEPKQILELAAALQRRYEKETANGSAGKLPILSTADAAPHAAADDGPNYCGDVNT